MTATTLAEAIRETNGLSAYDAGCKRILSEREILARIMQELLPEYAQCSVEDIARTCIVGDPLVGTAPVRPQPRVAGVRNDLADPLEGRLTYDICFLARLPGSDGDEGGEPVGLMVNIEAQGESGPGYPLLSRAQYYCARMLSAQYGEVFSNSHYERLRKVYSVWVCLKPPKGLENTISRWSFEREDVVGAVGGDPGADGLMSVVVVRLGRPGTAGYTGILGLLGTLLAADVPEAEKLRVLTDEYHIDPTAHLENGMELMGTMGELLYKEAFEKGLEDGRAVGLEQGREQGLEQGLERGLEQGREQGIEQGQAQGQEQARADALRNLVQATGWSLDQAMDALGIPEDARPGLAALLGTAG